MSYTHLRMKGCTCFCCETKKSTKPVFVSFVTRLTNRKSQGSIPTQTMYYWDLLRGNYSKLPYICIVWSCLFPPIWVISSPLWKNNKLILKCKGWMDHHVNGHFHGWRNPCNVPNSSALTHSPTVFQTVISNNLKVLIPTPNISIWLDIYMTSHCTWKPCGKPTKMQLYILIQ